MSPQLSLLVTQPQVAKIFRKNVRTIQRWEEEGFPRAPGKKVLYSLPDCIEWVLANEQKGDFNEARTKKTEAEAQIKELELARLRGEMVPVSDVLAMVAGPIEAVDAKLRTMPRLKAKAWSRRLKITQAEAIALIRELAEEVRADLKATLEKEADRAA